MLAPLGSLSGEARVAYRRRDYRAAAVTYGRLIQACARSDVAPADVAFAYYNRACCRVKLPSRAALAAAVDDAELARRLAAPVDKAYFTLAVGLVKAKDPRLRPDFEWVPVTQRQLSTGFTPPQMPFAVGQTENNTTNATEDAGAEVAAQTTVKFRKSRQATSQTDVVASQSSSTAGSLEMQFPLQLSNAQDLLQQMREEQESSSKEALAKPDLSLVLIEGDDTDEDLMKEFSPHWSGFPPGQVGIESFSVRHNLEGAGQRVRI